MDIEWLEENHAEGEISQCTTYIRTDILVEIFNIAHGRQWELSGLRTQSCTDFQYTFNPNAIKCPKGQTASELFLTAKLIFYN